MQPWEYLTEDDVTPDRLAALGAQGWELVGVYPAPGPIHTANGTITQITARVVTYLESGLHSADAFSFPVTNGRMVFKRPMDPAKAALAKTA